MLRFDCIFLCGVTKDNNANILYLGDSFYVAGIVLNY